MLAALSSTTYLTEVVLGVVFGFALYRVSTSFRQQWGRPPWNIPPWGWFAIGFVLGLLGMLLYLIAHATTKGSIRRHGGATPYGSGSGYPQGYTPPPPAGYTPPPPAGSTPPPPAGSTPPPVPPPSVPPQGWAPPAGGTAETSTDQPPS